MIQTIKESYNEIYNNFLKDKEEQKMVYNDFKRKISYKIFK